MNCRYVFSLVLNAHIPFVKQFTGSGDLSHSGEESWFFEALSETYLPLFEVFDRLEGDHVPFHLAVSLSPTLCQMMSDELLLQKYLFYTEKQIEFGRRELERTAANPELYRLTKQYFDQMVDRRIAFTERYESNILAVFEHYQRKGKIDILGTSATHAFLPFLCSQQEALQAQMEVALSCYHQSLHLRPQGFWPPEFGWTGELESCLRQYNFNYTIVDSHGLIFGNPAPAHGTFYPVKTPSGVFVLARNFYAKQDLTRIRAENIWRDNNLDAGYELPAEDIAPFISQDGARCPTGFKYWRSCAGQGQQILYNHEAAQIAVEEQARAFLEAQTRRLAEAAEQMKELPLCLCAANADSFGRYWHEGPRFLETLFRLAAGSGEFQFMTPSEYLYRQPVSAIEVSSPEFSSCGTNGYAETWLHASGDWIYRHLARSLDRMVELAERFPDATGLKERALNQAARELLLAQSSDWPKLLYRQECTEYARAQIEDALRNFTTIYEALGSNYISTEWLTGLERHHNIFSFVNYRVFRRKQ
ncbi:MAG: DUF1957 domain-containing protein [Treponema sp.]|jgi:1,4-alpha-glucan branching enzyme|nr:DUF1957 domain-containing protein [Treponema sp.]